MEVNPLQLLKQLEKLTTSVLYLNRLAGRVVNRWHPAKVPLKLVASVLYLNRSSEIELTLVLLKQKAKSVACVLYLKRSVGMEVTS